MRWICLLGPSPGGARAATLHGRELVVLVPPGVAVPAEVARHASRVVFGGITRYEEARETVDRLTAELGPPELLLSFTEYAQETCARIATELGLPSVSPQAAAMTRDKARMRHALACTPYAWPYVTGTAREVADAVTASPEGTAWIVKPVDGAGSGGVAALGSRAAVADWLGGADGTQLYIAEHEAGGPEFSVEAVSAAGEHTILAVTAKQTTGSPGFVETGHVVPAPLDDRETGLLHTAVRCVLDTLGIEFGASHTEVRLDPGHGPVVIETHTRVGGDCIPELVELATGADQYERSVAALLGTAPALTAEPAAGAAAIAFVVPPVPGRLRGLVTGAAEGVVRWEFEHGIGADIAPVRSSADRLGYVLVSGAGPAEAAERAAKAVAAVDVVVDDRV
ncbi:ATP-grasp domain-containing protein [Streptomyces sp. NPDC059398]|uniref:ATP-grasp domain-containing protein n=1 Tax=Streptomyces sp. NPDC059398 TaxID=3346820 RepID=UPI0036813FE8